MEEVEEIVGVRVEDITPEKIEKKTEKKVEEAAKIVEEKKKDVLTAIAKAESSDDDFLPAKPKEAVVKDAMQLLTQTELPRYEPAPEDSFMKSLSPQCLAILFSAFILLLWVV